MPRNAKTVLGWIPLPAMQRASLPHQPIPQPQEEQQPQQQAPEPLESALTVIELLPPEPEPLPPDPQQALDLHARDARDARDARHARSMAAIPTSHLRLIADDDPMFGASSHLRYLRLAAAISLVSSIAVMLWYLIFGDP